MSSPVWLGSTGKPSQTRKDVSGVLGDGTLWVEKTREGVPGGENCKNKGQEACLGVGWEDPVLLADPLLTVSSFRLRTRSGWILRVKHKSRWQLIIKSH